MLQVCKLQLFTLSRWATVGASCRSLIASALVGMLPLAQHCRRRKVFSDYYLGGIQHWSTQVQSLCIRAAVAGHPPNAALLIVLEDDRLCMNFPEVKVAMCEEICYVEGLSEGFWMILNSLTSHTGGSLGIRSDCVTACYVSLAFAEYRIHQVLDEPLWTFVRADLDVGLAELRSSDDNPPDEVLTKAWKLLRLGPCMPGR